MANKKLKLLYLARYLREETDERHPRTVQDMIAYLERQGISAERKSIYDDLELLELYGMDVQTVRGKTYGYFLGEREFQLPELKLLIDVVQASPFLTQSKSMELIAKLEQLTSRPNARQLRRQVYVMDRVRTHNEKLYYAIDGLNTAINDDRKVTFRYFDWTPDGGKAYRRGGTPYETNPVALCVDKHYYLVAYDPAIQDYRHYRVDRMESLTVTDAPRDPLPEQFDLGKYVKTIFDMYNGRTETVQLRFDRLLYFLRPLLYSATHSFTNLPDWISLRIFSISFFVLSVITRGPRVTSPYFAVSDMENLMPDMPLWFMRSTISLSSWQHSKYAISGLYPALTRVSKPAWISALTPPQRTACSPKRSVSISSLKVVSITPARVAPMPSAHAKAIAFASFPPCATAMRAGTPLFSRYCERTVWPGPLGATIITFMPAGTLMRPEWIESPCKNTRVLPFVRFGAISFS